MINPKLYMGLLEAGFSFIPCNNKKPLGKWSNLQKEQPNKAQISKWSTKNAKQVALICGPVSGGLECIDFDLKNCKDPEIKWEKIYNQIDELIGIEGLYIESTPSGGYHIFYRTEEPEGNLKLASEENQKEAFIETRGKGGYCIIAPSEDYKKVTGDILFLRLLKQDDRNDLIELMRSFNKEFKQVITPTKNKSKTSTGPWVEYDQKDDFKSILEKHGWEDTGEKDNERSYWKRPGSKNIRSASWNPELRLFYVFTTSTEFENNRAYSPSAILATLEFNGDFSLMSKSLLRAKGTDHKPRNNDKRTRQPVLRDKTLQAIEYIKDQGIMRNRLTEDLEHIKSRSIVDNEDIATIRLMLSDFYKIAFDKQKVIFCSNHIENYHPVEQYVQRMIERNEDTTSLEKYINHFQFKTKDPTKIQMQRSLIRTWLMQFPAIILDTKTAADLMLVLIGPKGLGKTYALEFLMGNEMSKYTISEPFPKSEDKDHAMKYCSNWLYIIDEMVGVNDRTIDSLKATLSKRIFQVRLPYAATISKKRRTAVFAGTCNSIEVLHDDSGNRRILPLELVGRDYKIFDSIDKDTLISAICSEWHKDQTSHKLTEDQRDFINGISSDFSTQSPEMEQVQLHFNHSKINEGHFLTSSEISSLLQQRIEIKLSANKVGKALIHLGFEKKSKRINGKSIKGYWITYNPDTMRDYNEALVRVRQENSMKVHYGNV